MSELNLMDKAPDYPGIKVKVYENRLLTEAEILEYYLDGTIPFYIQTTGPIDVNYIDSAKPPVIDDNEPMYLCLLTNYIVRTEFNNIPHIDVVCTIIENLMPWVTKVIDYLELPGDQLLFHVIGNKTPSVTQHSIPSKVTYPINKTISREPYRRPYIVYKLSAWHKSGIEINSLIKRFQNTRLMRRFDNKAVTNNRFFNKKELRMCPYAA